MEERRTGNIEEDVRIMLDKYPFNEFERQLVDKYFEKIKRNKDDTYYEVWKYANNLMDEKAERGELYGFMTEEKRQIRDKLRQWGINKLTNEEYEILFEKPHPRKQVEELVPSVLTEEEMKERGIRGMLDKKSKKKLVELADSLDSKGFKREADEIDNIIRNAPSEFKLEMYTDQVGTEELPLADGSKETFIAKVQEELDSYAQANSYPRIVVDPAKVVQMGTGYNYPAMAEAGFDFTSKKATGE